MISEGLIQFLPFLPEIVIAFIAMFTLIFGLYGTFSKATWWIAGLFIFITLFLVLKNYEFFVTSGVVLGGLANDSISIWLKAVMMFFTILLLVFYGGMSRDKVWKHGQHEFVVIITLCLVGAMIVVSARNFLFLYVALELISLGSYVLAGFERDSAISSEAGVKYFILGSLSSCFMIFGMSYIYGFSGSLSFNSVSALISANLYSAGLVAGLSIFIIGLLFKLSIVPFHFWTPDVYQGSPFISVAFFTSVPKIASLIALINIINLVIKDAIDYFDKIFIILGILSIIVGGLGAIMQKSIKRLMGYSTVLNMGFVMIALSNGTSQGFSSAIIYQVLYSFTAIGIFAILTITIVPDADDYEISNLKGFGIVKKLAAFCMSIFMFSLVGIPPLAGFFGKFYVIESAIFAKEYIAAVIAIMLSVISAYYYINIVRVMYFSAPEGKQIRLHESSSLVCVISICTAVALLFPLLQHFL